MAVVLENRHLRGNDYLLRVKVKEEVEVKPGQFAMVQVRAPLQYDPLLRRPLGIFEFSGKELSFIYRVVGRGTRLLSRFEPGQEVEVLFPLGNSIPEGEEKYLFIAGGIGIGGLFLGAKLFKEMGKEVLLLYGERSVESLSALEFLEKYSIESRVYTEDGSYGEKGLVTKELEKFQDYTWVACGPTAMLRAVKEVAERLNVKCYLSLDRRMACGVGACLGCTVKTTKGYKRCCVEGPIFKADEVII
jgi:dihydroorotate dehydrogenase electron transfer subunit